MKKKSYSNKRVLFINLGWEQASYIDLLFSMGHKVYGVNNQSVVNDSRIEEVLVCDYFDIERIIKFATEHTIEVVITDECDYSAYAAAVVSEYLGCKGIGIEQALLTSNKFFQRKRIQKQKNSIFQPKFSLCMSPENACDFCSEVGFPIIIKPVDSRGSFGVSKVSDFSGVESAFMFALSNSPARQVIIEEFIDGVQITVDGYVDPVQGVQSLSLATKILIDDHTQVAIGIHYPGVINKKVYEKAMANNKLIVQALGIKFGMTHAEYIIDEKNDIYLVEIANRGGGCFTSTSILKSVTGVDFAKKLVDDYLCIDSFIDYRNIKSNLTNLLFFKIPIEGVVKSIKSGNELNDIDGLVDYKIMIREESAVTVTSNDANRHGFIIVNDSSSSVLVKKVLSLIKFEMYEGGVVSPILYQER